MDEDQEGNGSDQVKPKVIVEVVQNSHSCRPSFKIEEAVAEYVEDIGTLYNDIQIKEFPTEFLKENVISINICEIEEACKNKKGVNLEDCNIQYYIYQLHEEESNNIAYCGGGGDGGNGEEELSAGTHWMLPSSEFEGLWENLIYDNDIKPQLLNFVSTAMLFTEMGVDSNVISWNRMVLLHGPSGTGKTSLCKALAHKLCVRLSDKFKYGQLVEINSHSLFSKWFSESGKSVLKIFQAIEDMISDRSSLVVLLIDEVESLAHTRKMAMSSNEPSDSIRVVNALLTQIDSIKKHPNVLILTTSNVTEAIDTAFVDRADITQYIGLPSCPAIYKILRSCLMELMQKKLIFPMETILPFKSLERTNFEHKDAAHSRMDVSHLSLVLAEISMKAQGLSGRTLRKLPFLAHALYIQKTSVELHKFLEALAKVVDKKTKDKMEMDQNK